MKYYLLLFACYVLPNVGHSCGCIPLKEIDDKQYNEYQLILKGRIVKIGRDTYGKTLFLKVETNFKSEGISDIVKVSTPLTEGLCGITAKVGEHWLIFAYKQKNYFVTDLCTRTKTLERRAWNYKKEDTENDLRFLKNKLKAK